METASPDRWRHDSQGVNDRALLLANREWVYVAADKNARAVAGIRFKGMRFRNSGDDQEVFKGPLVDFLESPAPNLTGKDYIYLDTVYKELTGNAFFELLPGNQIAPLIPTNVAPLIEAGRFVAYEVTGAVGAQRRVDPDDMLHDRYIDPARPYWGVGKLQKIGRWVDTSFFANEFLRLFFVQGATFGGFIETEEESENRIKLIKAGLQNDHVGVGNAHKIAVLPKGNKFTPAGANMQEIQFAETDDRYRDKILATFGVPKNLLGITSGENRATVEGTEYTYMKHPIKPIVDDFI